MKYFLISDGFFLSIAMGLAVPLVSVHYFPQLINDSQSNNNNHSIMTFSQLSNKSLTVTSSAFNNNENIPSKFTCEGENVNPPLAIGNIPEGTKSLAIIMDDPDAPNGTFVHWVAYNISSNEIIKESKEPGIQGKNGAGKDGYTGPCPPTGTHHYHFKVYALDSKPDLQKSADKKTVEQAIKPHIIASGELIGLYKKTKS